MPLRGVVDPWLPPLLLMAAIFVLSAQPNLDSGLGLVDLIGRKIVHAGVYALLCVLWWRALRTQTSPGRALVAAVAISVAYSVTDELHQSTVEGRVGSPVDVLIDSAGVGLAMLAARTRRRRSGSVAP